MKFKLSFSLLLLASNFCFAQAPNIELSQVGTGFNTITCLANSGDNRLFVVEQAGRIRFFDPYNAQANSTFLDIQDRVNNSGNERGLLGLAFPPDYKTSGKFYVNYTASGGATRVSRFSISASDTNSADSNSEEILLTITQPFSNHNGGNIMFGPDGYLYIGMGDGGSGGDPSNYAQNTQSLLGKMLRIDVSTATSYAIPADNPYFGDNDPADTVLDEIWAIGVRNPWKYSFDRLTGDMWIGDVGQNVQEEVNFQPATSTGGENYGWRCYEGDATFNTSGCSGSSNYVFPVFTYNHSSANGCSITGGFVYRGLLYGNIYGRYFTTDYCSGRIWSIIQEDETTFTSTNHGQFTSFQYTAFGEDRFGELYLAQQNGAIFRIGSPDSAPSAVIEPSQTSICPGESITLTAQLNPLVSYVWYKDGEQITSAQSIEVSEPGSYTVEVVLDNLVSTVSEPRVIDLAPAPPSLIASAEIDTFCNDAAFPTSLIGLPIGGTFSGIGVVNALFDPFDLDAGEYEITYNYTTPEGCASDAASFVINILELPDVSISGLDPQYCANIDIAVMPELNPAGGLFYGPGVSNGVFSPSSAEIGNNEVLYTYADEFGCANTASFVILVDECLGIEESENRLIISPNPFSNYITVALPENFKGEAHCTVYNSLGQVVLTQGNLNLTSSNSFSLDLSDVAKGTYILNLESEGKAFKSTIIKQ
jgi:glucose/arabinose dehydrogenase